MEIIVFFFISLHTYIIDHIAYCGQRNLFTNIFLNKFLLRGTNPGISILNIFTWMFSSMDWYDNLLIILPPTLYQKIEQKTYTHEIKCDKTQAQYESVTSFSLVHKFFHTNLIRVPIQLQYRDTTLNQPCVYREGWYDRHGVWEEETKQLRRVLGVVDPSAPRILTTKNSSKVLF